MGLRFYVLVLLLLNSIVAIPDCSAQGQATWIPLKPGIWMIQGEGSNSTIASGSEGVLLIDTDLAATAPDLRASIQQHGLAQPKWILNTHFHYDHTGGNALFSHEASVFATKALAQRLQTPQTLWREKHAARPAIEWPTVLLDAEIQLSVNQELVRLIPLRQGHTDGDAIVLFPQSGVAAVGDLMFGGMFPIVHPEHGGGLLVMREHLAWIFQQLPEGGVVVPGHGPQQSREDLRDYLNMLDQSIAHVRQQIALGKTLQEIQTLALPSICERYSHGYRTPAQWIEMIYVALQNEVST